MLVFASVVSVVQKRLVGASERRAGTGVRPQTGSVPPDEIRQTLASSRNCFIAFDVQNRWLSLVAISTWKISIAILRKGVIIRLIPARRTSLGS